MRDDIFSQEFVEIVREHFVVLLVVPVLAALVGYFGAAMVTPQYSSMALLHINPAMARDYGALAVALNRAVDPEKHSWRRH